MAWTQEQIRQTQQKATYGGIDLFKFIMALCVVMIHVKSFFPVFNPGPFVNFTISLAVPFFFTASGFLLANKMDGIHNEQAKTGAILKYSKRIWRMYFLWILIYIPLCLLGEYINPTGASLTRFVLNQARTAILIGEIRYSYPTWYLFSLGIAILAIYCFKRRRVTLLPLFILGVIGIFVQYWLYRIKITFSVYDLMTSRVTIGLGYVLFGMYLYNHRDYVRTISCVVLMIVACILYITGIPFSETLGSVALFILALMIKKGVRPEFSLWFRKQSMWIYLTHMYVVTPICLYALMTQGWAAFGVSILIFV